MTDALSAHRHISFTAHYTGYIWYSMGISHPVFATRKGKLLAKLVHPLESWAEKHVGGSMRTTLKQRHQMIDNHLSTLIQQHPNLQVLEIASGYLKDYAIKYNSSQSMQIIGPATPYVGKINDIFRKIIYLKDQEYDSLIDIKNKLEQYIEVNTGFNKVRIQFDFNPINIS